MANKTCRVPKCERAALPDCTVCQQHLPDPKDELAAVWTNPLAYYCFLRSCGYPPRISYFCTIAIFAPLDQLPARWRVTSFLKD